MDEQCDGMKVSEIIADSIILNSYILMNGN